MGIINIKYIICMLIYIRNIDYMIDTNNKDIYKRISDGCGEG